MINISMTDKEWTLACAALHYLSVDDRGRKDEYYDECMELIRKLREARNNEEGK